MAGTLTYQETTLSRMAMDTVMEMIRSASTKSRTRLSEWILCHNYYGVVCILGHQLVV